MKKIYLSLLFLLMFILSGCSSDINYENSYPDEYSNEIEADYACSEDVENENINEQKSNIPHGKYIIKDIRECYNYYEYDVILDGIPDTLYHVNIILEDSNQKRYYYTYNRPERNTSYVKMAVLVPGDIVYYDGEFNLLVGETTLDNESESINIDDKSDNISE